MPARSNSCGVAPSAHEKKASKSTACRASFVSTPGTVNASVGRARRTSGMALRVCGRSRVQCAIQSYHRTRSSRVRSIVRRTLVRQSQLHTPLYCPLHIGCQRDAGVPLGPR
eukprot:5649118-Prymnesium_polylepis.1